MKKILVIGSINVDYASKVDVLPKGNEEINLDNSFARISGFGWNVANLFQQLQVSYDLLASVGTGENGDLIRTVANKLNIPLNYSSEQIHGCTCTMIDSSGKTSGMVIPGAEYNFPYYDLDEFNLNDYEAIICSDLEMPNLFLEEYLQVLESFEGNIYYVTSDHGMVMNEDLRTMLFSLRPIIIARTKEILELSNSDSKDAVDSARLLSLKTSKQVVLMQLSESYSIDAETIHGTDEQEVNVVDESGSLDAFAAGYVLAKETGILEEKALSFASLCARLCASSFETIVPQSCVQEIEEELSKVILK